MSLQLRPEDEHDSAAAAAASPDDSEPLTPLHRNGQSTRSFEAPVLAPLDRFAQIYIPSWLKAVNEDVSFTYIPLDPRFPSNAVNFDEYARHVWPAPIWDAMRDVSGGDTASEPSTTALNGGSFNDESRFEQDNSDGENEDFDPTRRSPIVPNRTLHPAAELRPIPSDDTSTTRSSIELLSQAPASSGSRPLSASKYQEYWHPLIEAEMLCRRAEMRDCSAYAQQLRPYGSSASPHGATPDGWDPDGLYLLHLPGIREDRPKLVAGDTLQLRPLNPGVGYGHLQDSGWLHLVFEAKVSAVQALKGELVISCPPLQEYLKFHFPTVHEMRTNVQFPYEGAFMQESLSAIQHLASRLSNSPEQRRWFNDALFPEAFTKHASARPAEGDGTASVYEYDDSLNREQRAAVVAMTSRTHRIPFLLSGPPGTGKTKTSVEAILQLAREPSHHILVVTPSHAASDVLTRRLAKHLEPHHLLRLNGPARTFAETPQSVAMFCYVDARLNSYSLPPWYQLMRYRVVVCTAFDVSLLLNSKTSSNNDFGNLQTTFSPLLGVDSRGHTEIRLHWTHLLVDEAAQGTEPDLAPALAAIMPHKRCRQAPSIILVGDPAQLGPAVRSQDAASSGLSMSLLERLSRRPVYAEALAQLKRQARALVLSGDTRTPTSEKRSGNRMQHLRDAARDHCGHLIRNYRARHPALLHTSSSLFYADSLVPSATPTPHSLSMLQWPGLRRRGIQDGLPLLFLDQRSDEDWVDEGVSWKNEGEAQQIVSICQSLTAPSDRAGAWPHRVQAENIAVISPFREQVWRIRILLRRAGLRAVNVGPVEAFQGQESDVVIISPVRSQSRFIDRDKKLSVGLIAEPKRLNVALTRARDLLIIVGNAECLSACEDWRQILAHARRNEWIVRSNDEAWLRLRLLSSGIAQNRTTHSPDQDAEDQQVRLDTGERISALESAESSGRGWWQHMLNEAGLEHFARHEEGEREPGENRQAAASQREGGTSLLASRMATVAIQDDDDDEQAERQMRDSGASRHVVAD
ncbi:unnamed protein product [Parajaminaea phylloscopi]